MNLTVYHSKDELSIRFADYMNVYVLPLVSLFGMITNLINIVVTFGLKTRDHAISYILVNSLLDFVLLSTQFFVFLIRCGTLCPYNYTYAAQFYEQYVYVYFANNLVTGQAVYNTFMSYERLQFFRNNLVKRAESDQNRVINKLITVLVYVVALVPNAVFISFREIYPFGVYRRSNGSNSSGITIDGDEILYRRGFLTGLNPTLNNVVTIIAILVKSPLFYVIVGYLNVKIAIRFRHFIAKKKHFKLNAGNFVV